MALSSGVGVGDTTAVTVASGLTLDVEVEVGVNKTKGVEVLVAGGLVEAGNSLHRAQKTSRTAHRRINDVVL